MNFTSQATTLMLWLLLLAAAAARAAIPLHEITPTLPIDPVFAANALRSQPEFSTSHCFSNSLQADGWRTTACYVRNLCFNTTTKQFLFYSSSSNADEVLPPISIGTFNFKWGKQYDKTVKFQPRIVQGPIPTNRAMASTEELWIPHLPLCGANIGHLIWDDYLAWYLLSAAMSPLVGHKFAMRPLWYNPPEDPPWATCDWIRLHEGPGHNLQAGYSKRCLNNNRRWLPHMIGQGNEHLLETHEFAPLGDRDLVCFPHSASGLTAFSNQGSGHHGWNPNDAAPPAFGRAPLLFAFTRHMMKHIGVAEAAKRSLKEIVIFFSSRSSERINLNFNRHVKAVEDALPELTQLVRSARGNSASELTITVKHAELFTMTAKEQVEMVSTACMYVTAAGGGAFTAQFLPRGSSLLLYEEADGEHHHKGRVDWKFFNALGWVRPTFRPSKEYGDLDLLMQHVKRELVQCAYFMEALI